MQVDLTTEGGISENVLTLEKLFKGNFPYEIMATYIII